MRAAFVFLTVFFGSAVLPALAAPHYAPYEYPGAGSNSGSNSGPNSGSEYPTSAEEWRHHHYNESWTTTSAAPAPTHNSKAYTKGQTAGIAVGAGVAGLGLGALLTKLIRVKREEEAPMVVRIHED